MTRNDIINDVYRSLRDAFNSLTNVRRRGNTVIIEKNNKKATVSFRIKIEEIESAEKTVTL